MKCASVVWLPDLEDTLYYSDITVVFAFDSVPFNSTHDITNKAFVSPVKVD
jgi:hypothetical protein